MLAINCVASSGRTCGGVGIHWRLHRGIGPQDHFSQQAANESLYWKLCIYKRTHGTHLHALVPIYCVFGLPWTWWHHNDLHWKCNSCSCQTLLSSPPEQHCFKRSAVSFGGNVSYSELGWCIAKFQDFIFCMFIQHVKSFSKGTDHWLSLDVATQLHEPFCSQAWVTRRALEMAIREG